MIDLTFGVACVWLCVCVLVVQGVKNSCFIQIHARKEK